MTSPAPRIGIFGSAFDPPHNAHVALALAALAQLALDHLLVFPTGQAWHKTRPLSGAAHRLAMARLAFDGMERVSVDDRELRRTGPTYTFDTLTGCATVPDRRRRPGGRATELAPVAGHPEDRYNFNSFPWPSDAGTGLYLC